MQAISSKIPFMNYEEGMVCFVSCRLLQLGQRWGKEWILSYTEIPFCIVQNWLTTEFKLFGSEEVIKREKYSWTDNKISKIRKCFSPQMNFSDHKITSPDYSVCVTYIQKTPNSYFLSSMPKKYSKYQIYEAGLCKCLVQFLNQCQIRFDF